MLLLFPALHLVDLVAGQRFLLPRFFVVHDVLRAVKGHASMSFLMI